MSQIVAIIYCLVILGVIGFQVCLIVGKPWGKITQGGKWPDVLPIQGRIIAFISIFILVFMGTAILSAAELLVDFPPWLIWTAIAIQSISMVLNWITPSVPERRLWGPITSVMTGLALVSVLA